MTKGPEQQTLTTQQAIDLAVQRHNAGDLVKAEFIYQQILQAEPNQPIALRLLGTLFHQLGKNDIAIDFLTKALALNPGDAEAHNNLGYTFQALNKLEQAEANYLKALAIYPDYVEAHCNLGNTYKERGMTDDAVASYHKAIGINPDYAVAHSNLGLALRDLGKLDEGAASCRRALAISPSLPAAHLNLSVILLLQGNLKEGWEEFEWGLKIEKGKRAFTLQAEMWPGSSLHGKSILVHAEQGVGDEIMFASCVGDLMERSPDKLYLECDPRLEALFARSFPGVYVHGKTKDADISWLGDNIRPNFALPIGSLPKFFRNSVAEFPERDAYLTPNPELVEKWLQRLSGLKAGLKIGISWKGGGEENVSKRASIPLPEWRPLLSLDASFINLQYGDVREDLAKLGGIHIHDWDDNDPLTDLDNQAALISCLDLVVTIDNATVHMSGALGTQTWALLEQVPDWRWPEIFGDLPPLYRSVRLFRQKRLFEWGDVFKCVETALRRRIERAQTTGHEPLSDSSK
jgi:tetratricopeptide (TPR) repeat protein